jgi:hypothetical protein
METFSPEIHDKIGYYVYRLIDPRNGQTFYVGKGRGNRIFQHVQGALKQEEVSDEDEMDLKNTTILGIKHVGLSVIHVIHRHGIKSDEIAHEVEAALIDAYPGLTNISGGHGSTERGCRHVEQIKSAYAAEPLVAKEPLILICVSRSLAEGRETYDAVRGIWKMARKEAEKRALVLAYDGLLVIGAYRPEKWLVGTKSNFPFVKEDHPDRIGFVGAPAKDVWADYVGKRVPARHKGAIGPFRYLAPGRSGEPEDLDS